MKRKALFVGVNAYEDEQIRDLDFSLSDAHALKTMFELFGFESDILENPNKSDVFHAVRQMTADLGTGDLFFFYFAGHGWTTTSGKHLLFCSDDMYEDLRDDDAGISFDKLKRKTNGDYNRAFVLDACRSDFITGTRGGDTTTRDLRPIGELVKDAPVKSSLAVLRSCSQYEHALEIRSRKHGLFTLAMMEVLRTSKECGSELLFGESLCDAVTNKMLCIAKTEGITAEQTPEFAKTGSAQVLIEGRRAAIPSTAKPTAGAQNFVACPICGRHNDVKDTFKCPICGKDHLCLSHQSKDVYCCPSCAEKQTRKDVKTAAFIGKHVQMVDISDEGEYEGGLDSKGLPHGKGKFTYLEDGVNCVCEGEFSHGTRNGFFTMAYDDGARYDGTLWNGVRSGKGKWTTQSGGVYEGEFKDGQFSGFGVFRYTDGNRYEGDWFDGRKHGHGRIVHPDGKAEEGLWQDGKWAGLSIIPLIRRMEGSEIDESDKELKDGLSWYRNWFYREGNEIGDKEAVKCFQKSAEHGNPDAQYCLGACYVNGQGVEKNLDLALKWLWKASDSGQKMAKEALRKYEQSWVFERDKERAARPLWRKIFS